MPDARDLGELNLALVGPPPVLSTEDPKQFDSMFARLVACLEPQDVVEMILIRRYAHEIWMNERYARHATIAIDRRYRQVQQALATKIKRRNKQTAEAGTGGLVESGVKPADIAHLIDLEDDIWERAVDCDAILEHAATEIDHNLAIEGCATFLERMDRLRSSAIARADDALEMLEHYRAGLGKRVREQTQTIIDAEFRETEKTQPISYPTATQ